jgi:hypothetical protein
MQCVFFVCFVFVLCTLREAWIVRLTHEGHPGRRFRPLFDELKEVSVYLTYIIFATNQLTPMQHHHKCSNV